MIRLEIAGCLGDVLRGLGSLAQHDECRTELTAAHGLVREEPIGVILSVLAVPRSRPGDITLFKRFEVKLTISLGTLSRMEFLLNVIDPARRISCLEAW